MGVPQFIYIVLLAMGLGVNIAEHGQPKTGTNNAWAAVLAVAIQVGLLWWGGFFTN